MSKSNLHFPPDLLEFHASMCRQEETVMQILDYLANHYHSEEPITIARVAKEVIVERRVARLGKKNRIIGYHVLDNQPLGRGRAEKVVDKLAFAGLVEIQHIPPAKWVRLSDRGKQVIVKIKTEGGK